MASLLDDIAAEVSALSDEEIAEAATKIRARQQKAAASVTPERKARMKEQEKRRRLHNAQILKIAKEKGLIPASPTA